MGNPSYQALPSEIFRNDMVSRVTQSSASLTAQDVDAPQLELNEHMAEEICSQGKKKNENWYHRENGTNQTAIVESVDRGSGEELPGAAGELGKPRKIRRCLASACDLKSSCAVPTDAHVS